MTGPTPPRPDDSSEGAAAPNESGGATSIPEDGLGPPPGQDGTPEPGQDGTPEPTSEFLTPVRAYEPISAETGPTTTAAPGRRRPTTAIVGAAVVVALVAAVIIVASTFQRASGPPGAPRDLMATANVCAAPMCERIEVRTTLSWSSPDGEVDRFVVERDGVTVRRLPPSTTQVEVDGLLIDRSYTFAVRAIGSGTVGPPSEVEVRTPTPPLREAQLTGAYRVRETVRSATNLSSVEGIQNPRPGSETTNGWSFEVACADQAGACPTRWFEWGPLINRGANYDGTFHSRAADCSSGRTTPTTAEMHLVVTSAEAVAGRWKATRFHGTLELSFRCSGARSVGVLTVDGRAGS